jgi:serine/threonine-protein kinase
MATSLRIKPKQMLGKYRIESKLGDGGFATVYRAFDTLEGIRIALKVPYPHLVSPEWTEDFRREIRINAQLRHPHVLPVKNAEMVEGGLVVAYPLGDRTLQDRLRSRMSLPTAIEYVQQLLSAVAYAHSKRVMHCDIKPENLILFDDHLMLSDFGLAKISARTLRASGSGTVGYIAPEQAMGRPSFRSDVFSLGLVSYRMVAGILPEWPYDWPFPSHSRLCQRAHPDLVQFLKRSLENDPRKRFSDAMAMESAFLRIRAKCLRFASKASVTQARTVPLKPRDWRTVRRRQFVKEFGSVLETDFTCQKCDGPVSEAMGFCPWCGDDRTYFPDRTRLSQCCPRCNRGLKLDWSYCPWCYGGGFELATQREYSDSRYVRGCQNSACDRKELLPFMKYCPWCRTKVRKRWKIPGVKETCTSCGWGVLSSYWSHCGWCGKALAAQRAA